MMELFNFPLPLPIWIGWIICYVVFFLWSIKYLFSKESFNFANTAQILSSLKYCNYHATPIWKLIFEYLLKSILMVIASNECCESLHEQRTPKFSLVWISAVKRSIGSTTDFHNHGEGPYQGLLLVESAYSRFHI